jgi:hypothetical protein
VSANKGRDANNAADALPAKILSLAKHRSNKRPVCGLAPHP